jgi:transposase-like protein
VLRRPRWSQAEKEQIVGAAMEPGAVAAEVARAAGIYPGQLFRWRRQVCELTQVPAVFTPVAVAAEAEALSAMAPEKGGVIEIEFATGGPMRISGSVDASMCGGTLRKTGEDMTETLELIPRQWKVIQHAREKFSCRACEAITQPPAPSHPIARGRAGWPTGLAPRRRP